jgi:hypothetical protein
MSIKNKYTDEIIYELKHYFPHLNSNGIDKIESKIKYVLIKMKREIESSNTTLKP